MMFGKKTPLELARLEMEAFRKRALQLEALQRAEATIGADALIAGGDTAGPAPTRWPPACSGSIASARTDARRAAICAACEELVRAELYPIHRLAEALREGYEFSGEDAEQMLAAAPAELAGVLPAASQPPVERWHAVPRPRAANLVDNG
jgi:hypothetical protein